jgi:pimeloyl-ACP methyl ester carboxylesterase
MTNRARLIGTRTPARPTGAVLVLHGGAARKERAVVSPTQLSVLRMVPIAARIARAGHGRLAVFRLLNSSRGWDSGRTPVDDVAWALEQVRDRYGDLPASLVGHSLGGRAAILSADQPAVRSVVALAPWVYPDDGHRDLGGRRVLVVHGDRDRIASPQRSAIVAEDLRRTAEVEYVLVPGGTHAMLSHRRAFDGAAAGFVTRTLLADPV